MRYPINPTVKFRRGDTAPEHPGLLFFVREAGKEVWLTQEEFDAKKKQVAERQKIAMDKWLSKPENVELKRAFTNAWRVTDRGTTKRRAIAARYRSTPNGKICNRMRSRIRQALLSESHCMDWLLGCSINEYAAHLESQFKEGMSWENMGKVWEVDHILPLSMFTLTDDAQLKTAFNFRNTRPMLKFQHRQKSDYVDGDNGQKVRAKTKKIIPFKAA